LVNSDIACDASVCIARPGVGGMDGGSGAVAVGGPPGGVPPSAGVRCLSSQARCSSTVPFTGAGPSISNGTPLFG